MGFFDYISMPFGYLMRFCCWISPGNNYLFALILFTIIVQLVLCLLFGIKQQRNMIKQASIAPMAAALRKKYAGRNDPVTKQKLQQETMELYQQNGYSPMGGCLPMLIQLPLIMALYNVIVAPLQNMFMLAGDKIDTLLKEICVNHTNLLSEGARLQLAQGQSRLAQVEVLKLAEAGKLDVLQGDAGVVADQLQGMADSFPSYTTFGMDFSANPQTALDAKTIGTLWPLLLVPVLIVVTMILSQKLTRRFSYQDPTMAQQGGGCSMKVMTYSMPVLSAYISLSMPAAVGVYWIYRSIVATLQQFILSKLMPLPKFTEEDYKKAEKEMFGTSKKNKKKDGTPYTGEKKRSLHHIDDDDDEIAPPAKKVEALEEKAEKEERDPDIDPANAPVMKDDKGSTKYKKK